MSSFVPSSSSSSSVLRLDSPLKPSSSASNLSAQHRTPSSISVSSFHDNSLTPVPPSNIRSVDQENIPPNPSASASLPVNPATSPNVNRKRKTMSVEPSAIPLSPERRAILNPPPSAPVRPQASLHCPPSPRTAALLCDETLPEELSHSIASSFAPSLSPLQYADLVRSMDSLVDKCYSLTCNAEFDRSYSLALQQAYKAALVWNSHLEEENESLHSENAILKEKLEKLDNSHRELTLLNRIMKEQMENEIGKTFKGLPNFDAIPVENSVMNSYCRDYLIGPPGAQNSNTSAVAPLSQAETGGSACGLPSLPSLPSMPPQESPDLMALHRSYRDLLSETAELQWKEAQRAREERDKFMESVRKSLWTKETAFQRGRVDCERAVLELHAELKRAKLEIEQLKGNAKASPDSAPNS